MFVDLNSDSHALLVAVGLGVGAFTFWRRTSLLGPMAVIGSVVLLTTLAGLGSRTPWLKVQSAKPAAAPDKSLPAIVHIILDEHVGVEGLPAANPGMPALREKLKAFYARRGFALYGGAYGRHLHTVNAIPYTLNYGRRLGAGASMKGARIGRTDYLSGLARRGYRLEILQTDFVDFCSDATYEKCVTYWSASLAPTLSLPWGPADRARLIAIKFAALSTIARGLQEPWNLLAPRLRRHGFRAEDLRIHSSAASSTVAAMLAFDMLRDSAARIQPGQALFAHLLLPHYPYAVASDCRYLPHGKWKVRRFVHAQRVRESAYFDQLRCAQRKVDLVLDALAKSPAGANSIVIIHGDHGSRITKLDPNIRNAGRYSDADMIAGFSTLFAVRAPGVAPAYYRGRAPVASLLRDFALGDFRNAPSPSPDARPTVFLENRALKPVRAVALPAAWVRAAGEQGADER